MQLIGAGLPRTGTLSQKAALEALGLGPCYHMVNVLSDLDLAAQWRRALDGDARWDEIFDGFGSTVDWPGSYFTRELAEAYPDAKVLLSVRDGEAWANSMRKTIWGLLYGDELMRHLSMARAEVDPQWGAYIAMMQSMWQTSGLLNGENTTAEWMASAMERYNEEIKRTIPAERLLVWSVADGWEPLCAFLELPVPDEPFPRLNDGKGFAQMLNDGSMAALTRWHAQSQDDAAATEPSGAANG